MAPPVEPALRALWELGGAPAATLRALERVGGVVRRFEPELEEAEQLAQAAVAPLLAAERGVGASALERVLARQGEVPPEAVEVPAARLPRAPEVEAKAARSPRAPEAKVEEERAAGAPVRPQPRRVPEKAPARAAPVERPPRALDAGALRKMAGPEVEAPRSNAPVAQPGRAARPAVVSAADARAALSRRAERAGAGEALRTPVRAEAAVAPAVPVEAAPAAEPSALGPDRGRAVAPERAREETRRRLLARPVRGAATAPAGGDRPRLSAESARAALAQRAERAGAAGGLQTSVTTEAEPGRPALLARAQEARPAPARAQAAAKLPEVSRLERALARTSGRVPRREAPPAAPADTHGEGAPLEGLAGLAARAPVARRGPPPVSLAGTAPPQPPIPAVLAERMEEAQLAQRLERILRREAEQAGVDLEELDP